jgi:hypothetical protein
MRPHHIHTLPQSHTFTPSLATLIETQARLSAQRATRRPVVWRRAFVAGAAILLALLSACAIPLTQDSGLDTPAVKPAQNQTFFQDSQEDVGLPAYLFDDFLAWL